MLLFLSELFFHQIKGEYVKMVTRGDEDAIFNSW